MDDLCICLTHFNERSFIRKMSAELSVNIKKKSHKNRSSEDPLGPVTTVSVRNRIECRRLFVYIQ